MLLFSDGVFLSGFCTEVLRGELYAESSTRRAVRQGFCTESATVRLHCVSSAPPVRLCGVNVKVHADGEETFTYCLNDSLYNLVKLVLRNITRK